MGYHIETEGAWTDRRKYICECQGQFILSLQADLRKNCQKYLSMRNCTVVSSLAKCIRKICISSWSHHDLSICGTSFIPVVYKLHSLIQYSPRCIINVCCRYESRATFEFKSGLPVSYSTFHKIALNTGIFQTARLAQVHSDYTSLNFPHCCILINIDLLFLIFLRPNCIMNFYL